MEQDWSSWLDFDSRSLEAVPESPGVFVMHASMKVLYIGSGQNIRQGLASRLSDECSSKAKRFKYMLTDSHEQAREGLIQEFRQKHQGSLPPCNHD